MKRVFLSIAIAFIFVVSYLIMLLVLFLNNDKKGIGMTALLYPISLPNVIYYYFFPLPPPDTLLPKLLFFISNVLLYSIPFYLLLILFSKLRKTKVPSTEPPSPPTFDS